MNYLNLLYKLYQYKKNTKRSREDILKRQAEKLRDILEYSYHHSTYYQRVFETVGITKENIRQIPISSFPSLDKATFVQYFDEIVTDVVLHQNDLQVFDEDIALTQMTYKGKYHVLGGVLSALDGVSPDDLNVDKLLDRLPKEEIGEVILALPATVDGQITSHYLVSRLKEHNVKITTLAQGIPVGAELDYMDEGTIQLAINSRKEM